MRLPTIAVPSLIFFGFIGFIVDYYNFMAIQSEIFVANAVLDANELELGVLGSLSALSYGLSAVCTGLLSERTGRKPLALLAIAGMGLVFLLCPYITSLWHVYAATVARSVFTGFLWAPLMAWMADIQPRHNFSSFLSWYNLSWAAGILAGFACAGYLYKEFGWKMSYHVAAACSGVTLLFLIFARPVPRIVHAPGPGMDPTIEPIELSAGETWYWIRQGLLCLVLGGFAASLVLYVIPKFDGGTVPEETQSGLNTLRTAGMMMAFYIFGRTARWHFKLWPVWVTGGFCAAGLALVALGKNEFWYSIGFATIGFGFGTGFMLCSYYSLALSQAKGKGSGTMELLVGGGGLLGPLFGGVMAKLLSPKQSVASGILVCIALALWALKRMARR